MDEILIQIAELEREIALLPPGSISTKKINGGTYFYYRISENGRRNEKYLPAEEEPALRAKIEKRKALEEKLKALKRKIPSPRPNKNSIEKYNTDIRLGDTLLEFCQSVKNFKKRSCFTELYNYVYGERTDKVFILYGLRRTGKTTMIKQLISEMSSSDLEKTAFIQVASKNTLAEVKHDLRILEQAKYKYIFIDEVTLLEDFIEGAAVFSDIFASCGIKIVLSGTDSLGFMLSKSEALYDRCDMLHTTFIPYHEFDEVLNIHDIDEYIRYGGTMSLSGVRYNETSPFASKKNADEYVDSAIATNIQHSLKYYQDGGHFRHLYELYEKNELTNAINRIVEDINHRFTIEVITRTFKSNDLSLSARNLRADKNGSDALDKIDIVTVTDKLKSLLEIKDIPEQSVKITDAHIAEIKEYLSILDLIRNIDTVTFTDYRKKSFRTAFTQPGLRYAQATALISSIMEDETFSSLSVGERKLVTDRIFNEIKGRMLEDIILMETQLAFPKKEVFKCQFAIGEFDMAVVDPNTLTCEIYEIKHSAAIVPEQYRFLTEVEKCDTMEFAYGKITDKYVLYRGSDTEVEEIKYRNIENYLKALK